MIRQSFVQRRNQGRREWLALRTSHIHTNKVADTNVLLTAVCIIAHRFDMDACLQRDVHAHLRLAETKLGRKGKIRYMDFHLHVPTHL